MPDEPDACKDATKARADNNDADRPILVYGEVSEFELVAIASLRIGGGGKCARRAREPSSGHGVAGSQRRAPRAVRDGSVEHLHASRLNTSTSLLQARSHAVAPGLQAGMPAGCCGEAHSQVRLHGSSRKKHKCSIEGSHLDRRWDHEPR